MTRLKTTIIVFFGIFSFTFLFISCSTINPQQSKTKQLKELYKVTIKSILREDIWNERDVDDLPEFLMVILDYAFKKQDVEITADFTALFKNFLQKDAHLILKDQSPRVQMQFYYLISEYIIAMNALNSEKDGQDIQNLIDLSLHYLLEFWNAPSWQWAECGVSEFKGGQIEKLRWQIDTIFPKQSYCNALNDDSHFAIALAANLKFIQRTTTYKFQGNGLQNINQVISLGHEIYQKYIVFLGSNRWLMQPGVLWDHPDYLYAGHRLKIPNLDPSPIRSVAGDSSHSFRMPKFLVSLKRVSESQEQKEYYQKLIDGLAEQMLKSVIVYPTEDFNNYRTTNYMDGVNGLFRYIYYTNAPNLGYGPFELSGSFLIGWWAFLDNPTITQIYCDISSRYPLSDLQISTYLGPDTTRERHPLIKGKNQFSSGLLEIVSLASCLRGN